MNTCPLIDILAQIPDPRRAQGQRYPLVALLALICAAMLCGYRSYSAIAEWGRNYGQTLWPALGFQGTTFPGATTFCYLLRRFELQPLEKHLGAWAANILSGLPCPAEELSALAIDGKALRGSRKQGAKAAHLLSVVSHHLGLTIWQQGVDDKTNEIPVCLEVLRTLLLTNRVVTVDALMTQREVAQTIVNKEGDYVMMAKGNQPTLQQDITFLFYPQQPWPLPQTVVETWEKGHGRREYRRLAVIDLAKGYLDWPGAKQVFQIERRRQPKSGKCSHEIVYGVTSLSVEKASPERLMRLIRGHWTIENRSHWVRDVTFDEDRSQVRVGHTPQVMAAFRNTIIGLMRSTGITQIVAACRRFAAQPESALRLIGLPI